MWQCPSNEMSTPKILYCTSDNGLVSPQSAGRSASTNFATFNACTSLSYFINGDATETDPQMVMMGDRNIGTSGTNPTPAASANTAANNSGVVSATKLGVAIDYNQWAWTQPDLHLKVGNIGLTDGSAAQTTISSLRTAFISGTNTIIQPDYNFPQ
jgi:hypothetical protein